MNQSSNSRWPSLAKDAEALGIQSPHLDRLRQHLSMNYGTGSIEMELRQEAAAALGRAGAKLDAAILAARLAEHRYREAVGLAERQTHAVEYATCRDRAHRARWELEVHREAIGLNRHDVLDEMYPPLPPLR